MTFNPQAYSCQPAEQCSYLPLAHANCHRPQAQWNPAVRARNHMDSDVTVPLY